MEIPIIIIGLAILFTIILFKFKKSKPANENTDRPSEEYLPRQQRQNDKLVVVKGANYSDLIKVVKGFCNTYNNGEYLALPRINKLIACTLRSSLKNSYFCT